MGIPYDKRDADEKWKTWGVTSCWPNKSSQEIKHKNKLIYPARGELVEHAEQTDIEQVITMPINGPNQPEPAA
jgi:hypothetical protein